MDYRRQGINQSRITGAVYAYESFIRGEELPENYYLSMYPERAETALIYRNITETGIDIDMLYTKVFSEDLNYCKFLVVLEALAELNLIEYNSAGRKVKRLKANGKVSLDTAPVLIKLKEKMGE